MIILALGTNLGDRLDNLQTGVKLLKEIVSSISTSLIFETKALLIDDSPTNWNKPYYNMIVSCKTDLEPLQLLEKLKQIEKQLGRTINDNKKWSPRIIDIDIIFYNDLIFNSSNLNIPHKEMLSRSFVMLPLYQLCPDVIHPKLNVKISEIMSNFKKYTNEFIKTIPFNPKLMGIINITPDSFSDGGKFQHIDVAIEQALKLIDDGAQILDIGAQSTNPNSNIISWEAEVERLKPILQTLAKASDNIKISIDSFYPEVFSNLIEKYKIDIVNDVSGKPNERMIEIVKANNIKYVLMHSLSVPANAKQYLPNDCNIIDTLKHWAHEKIQYLNKLGLSNESVIFDPGIGFGKTPLQNKIILNNLAEFRDLGLEILVGHSRKSFMNQFSNETAENRDLETAVISANICQHVDYLRVHNVELNRRAIVASNY